MLDLNVDLGELKRQMEYIEEHLMDCSSPQDSFICHQTYQALADMYYAHTGIDIYSNKMRSNQTVVHLANEMLDDILSKGDQNFIRYRKTHTKMLFENYVMTTTLFDEFLKSDYYRKISNQQISPVSGSSFEDLDLLLSYFKECAPELLEYYNTLNEQKLFFPLPKGDFFDIRGGITIFNSVENICSIFLNLNSISLDSFSSICHELGHAVDFFDYRTRFSAEKQGIDHYKSLYTEVISSYYEQQFLEYVLEHSSRKDEALVQMANYFYQRLQYVWEAGVISILPQEYISLAINGQISPMDAELILEEADIVSFSLNSDEDNELFSFDDDVEYGYGFILANWILDDKEKWGQFLNIRNGYFSPQKLESIGIFPETTAKQLTKKTEQYFGPYL